MLEKLIEHRLRKKKASLKEPLPLQVQLPSGTVVRFSEHPRMTVVLKRKRALLALLSPSLARIGEAYVEDALDFQGDIEDITACITRLVGVDRMKTLEGRRPSLASRLLAHTRRRDQRAVEYHYDASNDFYRLFLDQRMVYSCAYFQEGKETLDQAQLDKLDYILTKVNLKPGERLLDVGCGWGGLLIRAVERGATAVGVTLSQNQYDYCRQLIAKHGMQARCEVRLQDYRAIPERGGYDKIVSVGMVEHVGLKKLPQYFNILETLLKDDGAMLLHGITSNSVKYRDVGAGAGRFINRYVFPDGELVHVSHVMREMGAAGLEIIDVESLRRHYAKTLTHWSHRLEAHANRAVELVGERRYRIWRVYLAGCAFGFSQDWINIYQLLARKRMPGEDNPFPMTREYMYTQHG